MHEFTLHHLVLVAHRSNIVSVMEEDDYLLNTTDKLYQQNKCRTITTPTDGKYTILKINALACWLYKTPPNCNNLPVNGLLLRFFSTFVGELRNLGSRHMKKEEALCSSSIWKRRKFSNCILRWHSGSHAIAWAAITTSVCKVSYDLQIKTWLCSSRFIYL